MKAKMFPGLKWTLTVTGLALISFGATAQPNPGDPGAPVAAVAAGDPTIPADLSPGLAQVVKLAEANVGDSVILSYVQSSGQATAPTADEILYLKDVGVSDAVITALLQAPAPAAVPAPAPAPVYQPAPVVQPQAVSTAAPTEPVTTAYFEEQLSPYGSWVEVPEYGRCWQPTVVVADRGWRPYGDRGHWVYTDAGWYWQSDYSWGWAAFHYGRWFNHGRYGWVWAPDNVWGPSWVCWRQTDVQCGWAPLPPGARFEAGVGFSFHGGRVGANFDFGLNLGLFTFVGFDHFCDRDVHRYYTPRRDVVNIYNRSTVINNYTVVNRTVINEGISRDRVAAISHRAVPRVTIHETTTATPGRVDHFTRNGNGLNVFRPTPNTMVSHVQTQRETQRHTPFVVNRATTQRSTTTTTTVDHGHVNNNNNTRPTPERNTPIPNRISANPEPSHSTRNIVVSHDPAPVTHGPAPVTHTPAPVSHTPAPVTHSPVTAPERVVTEPAHSTTPFSSTGHHAVEHQNYQPRGWAGNSESTPSVSHAPSVNNNITVPRQSAAPNITHSTPTFSHSYTAPAAPAAPIFRAPNTPSAPASTPSANPSGRDRR